MPTSPVRPLSPSSRLWSIASSLCKRCFGFPSQQSQQLLLPPLPCSFCSKRCCALQKGVDRKINNNHPTTTELACLPLCVRFVPKRCTTAAAQKQPPPRTEFASPAFVSSKSAMYSVRTEKRSTATTTIQHNNHLAAAAWVLFCFCSRATVFSFSVPNCNKRATA